MSCVAINAESAPGLLCGAVDVAYAPRMSAELDDEMRREAQRMRAYDVLSKPVRMQQLTQIVCSALMAVYGWCPPDARR